MTLAVPSVARAEGPQDPFEPLWTWSPAGSTQALQVRSRPAVEVTVTFRAVLAELEHTWTQGPYTMCARAWATSDACHDDDPYELPFSRWLISASHHPALGALGGTQATSFHMWNAAVPECE